MKKINRGILKEAGLLGTAGIAVGRAAGRAGVGLGKATLGVGRKAIRNPGKSLTAGFIGLTAKEGAGRASKAYNNYGSNVKNMAPKVDSTTFDVPKSIFKTSSEEIESIEKQAKFKKIPSAIKELGNSRAAKRVVKDYKKLHSGARKINESDKVRRGAKALAPAAAIGTVGLSAHKNNETDKDNRYSYLPQLVGGSIATGALAHKGMGGKPLNAIGRGVAKGTSKTLGRYKPIRMAKKSVKAGWDNVKNAKKWKGSGQGGGTTTSLKGIGGDINTDKVADKVFKEMKKKKMVLDEETAKRVSEQLSKGAPRRTIENLMMGAGTGVGLAGGSFMFNSLADSHFRDNDKDELRKLLRASKDGTPKEKDHVKLPKDQLEEIMNKNASFNKIKNSAKKAAKSKAGSNFLNRAKEGAIFTGISSGAIGARNAIRSGDNKGSKNSDKVVIDIPVEELNKEASLKRVNPKKIKNAAKGLGVTAAGAAGWLAPAVVADEVRDRRRSDDELAPIRDGQARITIETSDSGSQRQRSEDSGFAGRSMRKMASLEEKMNNVNTDKKMKKRNEKKFKRIDLREGEVGRSRRQPMHQGDPINP